MNLNTKKLPLLSALLGILTFLLRLGLFLLGTDEKGLLIPWHPLDLLCWAVAAANLLLCILVVRKGKGSEIYQDNFSPSVPAAAGSFTLAVCIAATLLFGWGGMTRLELIRNFCGLAAVPALVWAGLCRSQGKRPFFLCHALVCLYLTLYAVSHYQIWCSQPQLQNYAFSMAGAMLLALFGYYQTAFDVDLGKRRMQIFVGLMAGFFCIAALADGRNVLLYLGGGVWSLTGLCRLTPVKRRPFPEQAGEEGHEAA